MRRKFSSRRSKPLRPGALPRVTGPPDGVGFARSDEQARRRGPERWIGSTEPETVSPPGAMRSKPINTARGTPRDLADLRLFGLQRASSLRGGGVRGSSGTRCVPRALDLFRRSGKLLTTTGDPRAGIKQQGRRSFGLLSFRGAAFRPRTRNPEASAECASGFRAWRHSASKTRVNALMSPSQNDRERHTPILSISRVLPMRAATRSRIGPSLRDCTGASVSAWRASR